MAQVIVELTGDEKRLLESYRKSQQADAEYRAKLKATGLAGKQAGDEIGDSFVKGGEKAGKDGIAPILKGLSRIGPEGRDVRKQLEGHFRETGKFGRKSMGDVIEELRKIDPAAAEVAIAARDSLKTVGDQGVNSAKRTESAMGKMKDGVEAKITAIGAAWFGVDRMVGKVLATTRKVLETNKEVFESLKKTQSGDARLLQVSESTEDFQGLRSNADRLASTYGIGREEARGLVFSARSEGFEGALDFIASNQQVVGTEAQATVGGQVPGLFKGQGVSAQQAINATLAGAAASRLSFEQIGGALPAAAASAAPGGSTAEETIGALSVFAGRFKSGEQGSDRIAALASRMNLDERTQGRGLVGGFEALRGMSDADRQEFLGSSKELNEAYSTFASEFDAIQQRIGEIRAAMDATGTDASPVARRRASAASDPMLAAQVQEQVSRTRLEIERENRRAVGEGGRQSRVNEALAGAEARRDSQVSIAVAEDVGAMLSGAGMGRAAPGAIDLVSGTDVSRLSLQNPTAAAAGLAGFISRQFGGGGEGDPVAAKLDRMAEASEETNRLLRENAEASKTTARNTKPKRADTSRVIEAAGESG